jgi:hypothetical protein
MNWKEINIYARMEYPKIGEPLWAEGLDFDRRRVVRWMPHIILDKNTGIFLNYWVEDIERCLEISRDKIIEIKKKRRRKLEI